MLAYWSAFRALDPYLRPKNTITNSVGPDAKSTKPNSATPPVHTSEPFLVSISTESMNPVNAVSL